MDQTIKDDLHHKPNESLHLQDFNWILSNLTWIMKRDQSLRIIKTHHLILLQSLITLTIESHWSLEHLLNHSRFFITMILPYLHPTYPFHLYLRSREKNLKLECIPNMQNTYHLHHLSITRTEPDWYRWVKQDSHFQAVHTPFSCLILLAWTQIDHLPWIFSFKRSSFFFYYLTTYLVSKSLNHQSHHTLADFCFCFALSLFLFFLYFVVLLFFDEERLGHYTPVFP